MLNLKGLYFLAPMFGRDKFEKRIINDLECPCYKIVGNTKYFANEEKHLWVVMKKRLVSVFIDEGQPKLEWDVHCIRLE